MALFAVPSARRWLMGALLLTGFFALSGCKGEEAPPPPQPTAADEAASMGDLEVRVTGTRVVSPQLVDSDGHSALIKVGPDRVFVVDLEFKNTGSAPVSYRPAHRGATAQPSAKPLLFKMPSGDDGLVAIAPVNITEGYFIQGQEHTAITIAPGQSAQDFYAFEIPRGEANLMLTVPAGMFGGSAGDMVRFELTNEPKVEPEPKPAGLGKVVKRGDIEIKVTGIEDAWVEAVQTVSAPGAEKLKYAYAYTNEPVLQISVEIKNTGGEALYYDPGHRASDSVGVQLQQLSPNNRTLTRFKLADADAAAKGQQTAALALEPGKAYTDVFLFQRPLTSGEAQVLLSLSGHVLSTIGLFEFELGYDRSEPTQPDWEPYKKDQKPDEETPE